MKDFEGNDDSRSCRSWLTGLAWHRPGLQWRTHTDENLVENSCVRRGLFDYWKLVMSWVLKGRPPLSPFPYIQTARQSTGHFPFTDSESLAQNKKKNINGFGKSDGFVQLKPYFMMKNQWKTIENQCKTILFNVNCLFYIGFPDIFIDAGRTSVKSVPIQTASQPARQSTGQSAFTDSESLAQNKKKISMVLAKVMVSSS